MQGLSRHCKGATKKQQALSPREGHGVSPVQSTKNQPNLKIITTPATLVDRHPLSTGKPFRTRLGKGCRPTIRNASGPYLGSKEHIVLILPTESGKASFRKPTTGRNSLRSSEQPLSSTYVPGLNRRP
jgi:hypothetical protein